MSKRIEYIDIAKGFAIICVVIGHVLCYDLYDMDKAAQQSHLLQFISSFHMPLFLFLSGLVSVTSIERKEISSDIWKRFRTILIPGIIVGGIYSLTISHDLSYFHDNMKGGYWYLWVLFIYYVISYFIAHRGGYFVSIVTYLIAITLWLVFHHVAAQVPTHISNTLSLVQMERFFPYFLAGNAVKRFGLHHLMFENTVVFVLCLCVWLFHDFLPNSFLFSYLVPLAASITIICVCRVVDQESKGWLRKSLICIGSNTLYIYVFHYFAIQCFRTSFFYDILPIYSTVGCDLLLTAIPASICILFSIGVGKVCQSHKQILKVIFGKE